MSLDRTSIPSPWKVGAHNPCGESLHLHITGFPSQWLKDVMYPITIFTKRKVTNNNFITTVWNLEQFETVQGMSRRGLLGHNCMTYQFISRVHKSMATTTFLSICFY